MENNTSESVLNLMQNVVDKLDEILEKIENTKNIKPELTSLIKLPENIDKLFLQQTAILKKIDISRQEVNSSLISNNRSNETHNYKYIMFGKDSPLNTRFLIYIVAFVVISWSGIKYLPSYFSEHSELKQEKENYQLFYNYLYLKQVESKNNGTQKLEVILNKIKEGDDKIYKEYNFLLTRYQKQLRKQELEYELKKLQ